ncbi:MAG: hypothetical protein GX804_02230 [Lentisphaerae bacterium]|nr:hypothetical protein [Lentisphaerota bacterium]
MTCNTQGVEAIVPVNVDFYITTRGVSSPPFEANVSVAAKYPWRLLLPPGGTTELGIGEYDVYKVEDETGVEDDAEGRIYVLKLDIEQSETNVCWKISSVTLNLTPDSAPGGEAVWTSQPAGISGAGNSVTFDPSSLAPGEYTVSARSGIVPDYYDSCVVRIIFVELEFQNSHMPAGKLIDPLMPSRDVRVGVIQGDKVKFKAKLTPIVALNSDDYVWTGVQSGRGFEIEIVFNTVGTHREQLQVLGCQHRIATTTVVNVSGYGETAWMALHPQYWISAFELRDEALNWARDNASALGGGIYNGRADAARHAYWNAIMTLNWNATDAEGLATAHEKTGLDNKMAHNETVMDIENNAVGRMIGSGSYTNLIQVQNAVIDALNKGILTILDDLKNVNEIGLLQPSNQ